MLQQFGSDPVGRLLDMAVSTALVVGAVAAVLQAVTIFKIFIVLARRWSNSRSFMAEWCRELVRKAERWLGKVSGTKKRIKAYRDVQRAILQHSCTCFMAAGAFRLIRIQVELSEATDPVYLALDIPVSGRLLDDADGAVATMRGFAICFGYSACRHAAPLCHGALLCKCGGCGSSCVPHHSPTAGFCLMGPVGLESACWALPM